MTQQTAEIQEDVFTPADLNENDSYATNCLQEQSVRKRGWPI